MNRQSEKHMRKGRRGVNGSSCNPHKMHMYVKGEVKEKAERVS